jgi:TolB-like protein/tetratricopeptide (TPR) repeat protein
VAESGGEGQTTADHSGTPDVFISYASSNSAVAEAVREAMEETGITCWIAPRDVTPGASYAGQIIHAIDAAKVLVLILSQNAASSPHVLREVERAASKRHPIVSLRIDQAPLPADFEYFLNTSHWLDANGGDTARVLPKLVSAVRVAIQASAALPDSPPTAHIDARSANMPTTTRTSIVVASVVGLAIAAFAGDRLWQSSHRTASAPAPTTPVSAPVFAPATSTIPERSVAVLPFVDMSEKHDQEYFSDGLSEELIDMLTRVPDLRVPARTSSFYFKGKSEDIPTIAKRLLVAHVLEGSVRKSGNRLRITAQLVRADNGYHLWSETYDRKVDDIFKVQDEIASAVVKALKISLFGIERANAAPTTNSEAYALYMQARSLVLRGTVADSVRAADYLQLAITLDPRFAPAYARLTQVRTFQYENGALPYERAIGEARRAAQKAIELDPNLAAAHLSMARVHYFEWKWGAANVEILRARQLDPGDADALRWAGISARTLGHLTESINLLQRAVDLDPLNGANYAMLDEANLAAGEFAAAELACRKAIELAPPTGFGARASLGIVLVARGMPEAALKVFEQLDNEDDREQGKALAYFALGRKADSDAALAVLTTRFAGTDSYAIAQVQAYRGLITEAYKWLDRAYQQHDSGLAFANTDWLLSKLRGDSRYREFLRKMNLPE